MDKFQTLLRRLDKAETIRRNYQPIWEDVSHYVAPNRSNFTSSQSTYSATTKTVPNIYDTTAILSAEMLASALFSGLTNDSTNWFTLTVGDVMLRNDPEVKKFLEETENLMREIFNETESSFSQQNHEVFLDLVAYGTGCLYIEEDDEHLIKFSSRHLNEIYIVEDYKGDVDTVFRKFCLTARQCAQQFGAPAILNSKISSLLDSDPDCMVDLIHCVYPNDDNSLKEIVGEFKYSSCYLLEGDVEPLSEGKFREMPYLVPRWTKRVGDVYGRSPAWNALADIKMLNSMKETMIKAAHKRLNPPLLVADDGVLQPVRTYPNALIYGGIDSTTNQPRIRTLDMVGDLGIGEVMIDKTTKAIRDAFYVDQLVFRDGPQMTATEVLQRQEESLRLLGPQVSRIQAEYLSPIIDRVFAILLRKGLIKNIPPILTGKKIDVEYRNPLHRLQKMDSVNAIGRTLQAIIPFVQVDPNVMDNFNSMKTVQYVADIMGVPLAVMRTNEGMAGMAAQRQQQQAMQQQLEMLKTGTEAGKNMGAMMSDLQGN